VDIEKQSMVTFKTIKSETVTQKNVNYIQNLYILRKVITTQRPFMGVG